MAQHRSASALLSEAVLDLFHASSGLMAAGDRLVAPLGLTSARWHVMGTIIAADRPQPVAWLARDMGANRQNVQRIVNDLVREGLVAIAPNPHHRRAHLIDLSAKGRAAFDQAILLKGPWMDRLTLGICPEDMAVTQRVLGLLRERLVAELDRDGA